MSAYVDAGYKILRYKWDGRFAKRLEKAWRRYLDAEATRLIIDRFSTEFLRENFQLIVDSAETSWNLRRLYLRVALHDLELLKQLRKTDEISYIYVAAKINHRVTSREALAIFNRHLDNADVGLLMWSFGQLGLWQVLDNIRTRLSEIERARFAKMMATSGTTYAH